MDDPEKPEFASWRSFDDFGRRVRHKRRFVWDAPIDAFLETVIATIKDRDVTLTQGLLFYRAQRGIDWVTRTDDDGNEVGEDLVGFSSVRMKPRQNRSTEGRANPSGVSVLYLANTEQTAISEVRPWIGDELSVAQFRISRDLRAIDLSHGFGQTAIGVVPLGHFFQGLPVDAAKKEKAVWIDIDNAFSKSLTEKELSDISGL
jgi:RES domain